MSDPQPRRPWWDRRDRDAAGTHVDELEYLPPAGAPHEPPPGPPPPQPPDGAGPAGTPSPQDPPPAAGAPASGGPPGPAGPEGSAATPAAWWTRWGPRHEATGPDRRWRWWVRPDGRLGPRSLTARLVAGVVALVLVLVAMIGTATYFSLRSFLFNRLDQQLAIAASQNAPFYGHCLEQGRCSNFFGPPPTSHEWVAMLAPDGSVVATVRGANVEPLQLSAALAQSLAGDPAQTVTVMAGSKELRVTARQTEAGTIVVTGMSTDEAVRTLHRLLALEIVIGAAAVAVAVLATSYGVQLSLRKLRRVTSTASEVAAELSPTGAGLDRRVDVSDDGSEVGQLAHSVNTLLSAVETQFAARLESEQRLRQFVADASHELRTPLTSIRGYAELARMQRAAGADTEDNLSRIESEGTRMSRLVEDLLMLARGEQGSTQPVRELVDVGEVVDDVANSTRAAFPGRPVETENAAGLHVLGDHDQLLRAVRNLSTNAAVHTAPGGPIRIRCAAEGDHVLIQVIDSGPGLPPELAAHVFERFWRADKARSRARGGTGLGMSIVATIVAAHGGTVRFDSSVERGSTVSIRLPAARA